MSHPGTTAATGGAGFCRDCDVAVKPVVRNGWGKIALFVAVTQLVAVIVSVVACCTPVDATAGPRRLLAAWPAAIHPAGLGVAAAVVSALATAYLADALNERAATCPGCRNAPPQPLR